MGTKEKQGLISAKDLTIQHLEGCESTYHRLVVVIVLVIQALHGSITTRKKYKATSSINCRERGSHARGVYPKQYTSRMGTARAKQEVGADTSVLAIEYKKSGREQREHEGEKSQTRPNYR